MRRIRVTYHHEDGLWWADSDDLPGFSAAASTQQELRGEVSAGVSFHLDDEHALISSFDESGSALDAESVYMPAFSASQWWMDRSDSGLATTAPDGPNSTGPSVLTWEAATAALVSV